MSRGKVLFLVLLLLFLVAILRWAEKPRKDFQERLSLLSFDPGEITSLELSLSDGTLLKLQRRGAEWFIGGNLKADRRRVEVLLSLFSTLEAERTVDPAPSSWACYGLNSPRRLHLRRGKVSLPTVFLGDKAPAGESVYLRVEGRPELFLVSSEKRSALGLSLWDWRDKRIVPFRTERAESLAWGQGGSAHGGELRRGKDGLWWLFLPAPFPAGESGVESFLSALSTLEALSEVEAASSQRIMKGAKAEGSGWVRVSLEGEELPLEVKLFKRGGESWAYSPRSGLFGKIDPARWEELVPSPDSLRELRPFLFDLSRIGRIDYGEGGRTIRIEREGDGQWKTTSRDSAHSGASVSEARVSALLDSLSTMRARAGWSEGEKRGSVPLEPLGNLNLSERETGLVRRYQILRLSREGVVVKDLSRSLFFLLDPREGRTLEGESLFGLVEGETR